MKAEPRQHRADLAGSLAARTTVRRYLEIIYGFSLGVLMWVVDAAMHLQLFADSSSTGRPLEQLVRPGVTPTLFRSGYLVVAVTLGWVLWYANLKREADARQKHDQALAAERLRSIVALVNTFRHDLTDPLALIEDNAQRLSQRTASTNDQAKLDEIAQSASKMSLLISQLSTSVPLYLVDSAGVERFVPHDAFDGRRN